MQLTGAQIIIEVLIEQGIDTVFGYPGGAVLNIYDELYKSADRIRHYITCHEQGASHAADGYARVTGKPGVVIATSGPGATNLVTGIATAYLDSSPIVAITGNVGCALIGKDSFQEVDILGITMPITKHNYIVKDIEKLADIIREALQIAVSGRPGPVLIDVPKDIQTAVAEFTPRNKIPVKCPKCVSGEAVSAAAELIKKSERPFIYAGGGVVIANAAKELIDFAERVDAPIGVSMMGLSAVPAGYRRNLGMTGMHGKYAASKVMSVSDLIIAVGSRFSDRATGSKPAFSNGRKILHIDIDPAEIGKNIPAYLSVLGDVKDVLTKLNEMLPEQKRPAWQQEIDNIRSCPDSRLEMAKNKLTPQSVIESVRNFTADDEIIATDVGQHQMWVSQYYKFSRPRTFITSGGLGTMGFGMGAAIGACIGNNRRRTILFTGDGSFHMNLNELATAVSSNLPLKIIIMNNNALGMVRQWQTIFFDKRYSYTSLGRKTDFVRLAESFGASGYRISGIGEVNTVLKAALGSDGPVVVDVLIDSDEMVLPMIPPGGTINDIILKG